MKWYKYTVACHHLHRHSPRLKIWVSWTASWETGRPLNHSGDIISSTMLGYQHLVCFHRAAFPPRLQISGPRLILWSAIQFKGKKLIQSSGQNAKEKGIVFVWRSLKAMLIRLEHSTTNGVQLIIGSTKNSYCSQWFRWIDCCFSK